MEGTRGDVAAAARKAHKSRQAQKTASSTRTSQGPYKKTPDCFCSLLNNSNQYFRDSWPWGSWGNEDYSQGHLFFQRHLLSWAERLMCGQKWQYCISRLQPKCFCYLHLSLKCKDVALFSLSKKWQWFLVFPLELDEQMLACISWSNTRWSDWVCVLFGFFLKPGLTACLDLNKNIFEWSIISFQCLYSCRCAEADISIITIKGCRLQSLSLFPPPTPGTKGADISLIQFLPGLSLSS